MITLPFIPGASKLRVIKAIKRTTNCTLLEAKDAVDLQRVSCEYEQREELIKAIEDAGEKVM